MSRRHSARGPPGLWWLALLGLAAALVAAQSCSGINVKQNGAAGNGSKDDTAAFVGMNAASGVGVIYMPRGTYLITRSITLNKPIIADPGAVFQLPSGVVLTLGAQPEHPLSRFFQGGGTVQFAAGTLRAYPEWWGAAGDGKTDDYAEIQAAYNSLVAAESAMLYFSNKVYAISAQLVLTTKVTIMSEDGATLLSINGATRGVLVPAGGFPHKVVLPTLQGFQDYCINLAATSLAMIQLQDLVSCGDAIRVTVAPGSGTYTALDNTVWFDKATNCARVVVFRANKNCNGPSCIIQGNQFIGNSVAGSTGSATAGVVAQFFDGPTRNVPAWDSNQFNFGGITPPASNANYAVVRAVPLSNRNVVKLGTVGALPPGGTVFDGQHNLGQFSINIKSRLAEGTFGLVGQLNLVEFSGMTTPASSQTVIGAMTKSNSKASFNGGKALVGNFFSLSAAPSTDWPAGTSRVFYIYHQMATGYLYQVKCGGPTMQATGLPPLACTQVQDNSQAGTMVPYEVQVTLINMSGTTIKAGKATPFTLAVATLGNV